METKFQAPFSDDQMVYDKGKRRYILTADYVANKGLDLSFLLSTDHLTVGVSAAEIALDRASLLVYEFIYTHGRERDNKEYMMACNPRFRPILRDAMFERLSYMLTGGDLSLNSGALIEQGMRIDTEDLVASLIEKQILSGAGLLHRGDYRFQRDLTIEY